MFLGEEEVDMFGSDDVCVCKQASMRANVGGAVLAWRSW